MPCALPPEIVNTILFHLLPPRPPLPPALVSKALTDRLTFLPPGRGEVDPYLTPTPSESNDLANHLEELSHGYTVGPVVYAHDGESTLAKVTIESTTCLRDPLARDSSLSPRGTGDGSIGSDISSGSRSSIGPDAAATTLPPLSVMFIHENQWKYHTTTTPTPSSHLSWSSDPEVATPPDHGDHAEHEQSAEEYWRGWSPQPGPVFAMEDDAEGEKAYWAKYGGGTGTGGATSRNPSFANFDHLTAPAPAPATGAAKPFTPAVGAGMERGEATEATGEKGRGGRVMCDLPTSNGAVDPLAALLATIPDSLPDQPAHATRQSTDLRDKVQGRIKGSLSDLWAVYAANGTDDPSGAVAEEFALGWIRLARGVVDRTSSPEQEAEKDAIVRAKMEVLRDLWEVTLDSDDDDEEASFWRCVEGVIRAAVPHDTEGEGMTQETYWE